MSYDPAELDFTALIINLVISFILTLFGYGAFPLIFALLRKKPISRGSYRGLCFGVNAVIMVIFAILNGCVTSGSPYVIWTIVFSAIGIRIIESRTGILAPTPGKGKPVYVTECTACGYQDESYFETCPKCGVFGSRTVDKNKKPAVVSKNCFCGKCGNRLAEGSKFCDNCGASVPGK